MSTTPPLTDGPIIEARGVAKSFTQPDSHEVVVIAPTDFAVHPGKIVALLGPSGSGKSTLLRLLAGLAAPTAGQVLWHGRAIDGDVPNAAIVFQNFALFPWLTVLENVEAPLEARGARAIERHKRALRILDTVGLDGYETAYPKELSGGMKQRVGFARALVVEPEVLFLDEPFSALDVLTAESLRNELLDLWLKKKIPTRAIFLVTHNIEEAVFLADRAIVLARNPARIRVDFDVLLPHPRDRKGPEFLELVDYVYTTLTQPEVDHAPPAVKVKLLNRTERPASPFPPLPHARPSGIRGLVEIVADRGGRDDLYKLAGALALEVDDLLPLLEGAALLGFVEVKQGDVELTPQGRAFAAADIPTQKDMFRTAALEHVKLLSQLHHCLHAKADHALPAEFFLDILDEHFSEAEARKQLETAIQWGRFAEILEYDSGRDQLSLHGHEHLAKDESLRR
jgi:NitT/TauT family transport system ATP-binding protein